MKKQIIITIILLVAILSGCSPASVPTPQIQEVTRIVNQTVMATELVVITQLVVVTATPEPPTPTPEATPTPAFAKWNSQQVVDAFKSAGLEAESSFIMTKDDYGMAPMVAIEGRYFFIPSLCSDCGGRILIFDNPEDLATSKSYYEELGQISAMFFSWVFEKDNIVVQINGDLDQTKADQYKAALEAMK